MPVVRCYAREASTLLTAELARCSSRNVAPPSCIHTPIGTDLNALARRREDGEQPNYQRRHCNFEGARAVGFGRARTPFGRG